MRLSLRAGDFSSRELTSAFLRRIEQLEPRLHAFITLTPELALAQAEQADRRLAGWRADPAGEIPALLGIPLVVKDVLCVSRYTLYLRLAHPGEFCPGFQCNCRRAVAGCRGGGAGQIEHR